jgi:UDP-GlcNAc:undecaprenyl-phosphate GlcNAc-1-phosphate transferase
VGFADDVWHLSATRKFAAQTAVAALVFFEGIKVIVPIPSWMGSYQAEIVSFFATIFWIVLITNAVNLIDGMDGLAAGTGAISALTIGIICFINGAFSSALISLILVGCLVGFLRHNFHPARIFLGDSGSYSVGMLLAVVSIEGVLQQKSLTLFLVSLPVATLVLPIFDTGTTVFRRWLRGGSLFMADKNHIHHRLLESGMSQRQAVLALYVASAVYGLISLLTLYSGREILVALVLTATPFAGLGYLGYTEGKQVREIFTQLKRQRRRSPALMHVRQAITQLNRSHSIEEIVSGLRSLTAAAPFHGFRLAVRVPFGSMDSQLNPQPGFDSFHADFMGAEGVNDNQSLENSDIAAPMALLEENVFSIPDTQDSTGDYGDGDNWHCVTHQYQRAEGLIEDAPEVLRLVPCRRDDLNMTVELEVEKTHGEHLLNLMNGPLLNALQQACERIPPQVLLRPMATSDNLEMGRLLES